MAPLARRTTAFYKSLQAVAWPGVMVCLLLAQCRQVPTAAPLAAAPAEKLNDRSITAPAGPGELPPPPGAVSAARLPAAPTVVCPDVAGPDAPPPPLTDPLRLVRNVHMTWQRDASASMSLTWTTEFSDSGRYVPRAIYAPQSAACADGRNLLAVGRTVRGIAEGTELAAWTVELRGLQPDVAYVARVGTWQDPAGTVSAPDMSELVHFRTAPRRGSRDPFTIVVAGDSRGGTQMIRKNIDRLAKIEAVAWFFTGDMTPIGNQGQWNDWFDAMRPVLLRRPLLPVQGNHEIYADLYYNQFALPAEPGLRAAYIEHAWSIDIGNVHWVGLDSNSAQKVEDQVPWLSRNLAAAQKDPNIDWTVCLMHHAPWSASAHGCTEYVRDTWGPVFDRYGVDLVVAGHDHDYERTVPIRDGKAAAPGKGTVYVVAGGFFSPGYPNGKDWWTVTSTHGDKNNYVVLQVDGARLSGTAWSGDDSERLDEWSLTQVP